MGHCGDARFPVDEVRHLVAPGRYTNLAPPNPSTGHTVGILFVILTDYEKNVE